MNPVRRFLIGAVWIAGCGELTTDPNTTLSVVEIHKESRTGARLKREEIITSGERWRAIWDEIVSDRSPKPPLPNVDFSSRVLIYVARGEYHWATVQLTTRGVAWAVKELIRMEAGCE
jgi:hypothetical protein